MNDTTNQSQTVNGPMIDQERDPQTLIRADRLDDVRLAYVAIARQIELLRSFDLGEIHPAVVYRPVRQMDEPR
ncbi:hypothetical protein [Aurantimonas sp. 22II-16-19i]|uniref:hypothetical protein n=1 Tax=Aurantimonas sp. 22II-16-19i TaxID=1317114 RepID=UPI0009F7D4F2|nr:hypothetical protein [Aurantimonas sp. 22II-16-19i]ORE91871.1 hypothetical protein ATO4_18179 [Aurantimonas sp. 22II-16-19i]